MIVRSTQQGISVSLAVILCGVGLLPVNAGEPVAVPIQAVIANPVFEEALLLTAPPLMATTPRDGATSPRGRGPVIEAASDITDRAKAFVDALAAADYEYAWTYLHPILQAEIPPTRIEQKWQALLRRTGPFERRLNTQTQRNLVIVKVKFGRTTDDLFVVFDNQGRIYSVDFPATETDDLFGKAVRISTPAKNQAKPPNPLGAVTPTPAAPSPPHPPASKSAQRATTPATTAEKQSLPLTHAAKYSPTPDRPAANYISPLLGPHRPASAGVAVFHSATATH